MFNRIQSRVLISVLATITVIALVFSYLLYDIQRSEYLHGVDQRLLTGAHMAHEIIGRDYHDKISNETSVTPEAYLEIVKAFNRICVEVDLQYLWSNLVLDDGTIVFTSGTSTSKDAAKGDHAGFFNAHSDPAAFDPVLKAGTTTFSSFDNEWGGGRMVLIPYTDSNGRRYVVGASLATTTLNSRLIETALQAFAVFIFMAGLGAVISVSVARNITGPIKKLIEATQAIAAGQYGARVAVPWGGLELRQLADNITTMSEAIKSRNTALEALIRRQEEQRKELRAARDDLEKRVAERTRELTQEIEDRKRAEQSLRVFSRAVEQSPYMMFITDPGGTIEYVNPRFTELTGYAAHEVVGHNPRLLKSGDMPPEFYRQMWDALFDCGSWRGEMKDRRKDGRMFWASAMISAVRNDNHELTHFIALHEDITERKIAEERVRAAKEQAETANRAKSELLANMSHELRTPLNAIIGFSETMLAEVLGPLDNDKHREYVGDIQTSGLHLLELINDILDVSAIEAGKLELHESDCDMNAVVETCLRLTKSRAEHGRIRVVTDLPKTPPILLGEERRLKQIVLNVLTNAVKFTPEGGSVSIALRTDDDGLAVVIADTGIGMDASGIATALEPFGQVESTLGRRYDGSGLGLPLSLKLMELHGGTLEITSEPGKGTTVTLRFPKERLV